MFMREYNNYYKFWEFRKSYSTLAPPLWKRYQTNQYLYFLPNFELFLIVLSAQCDFSKRTFIIRMSWSRELNY